MSETFICTRCGKEHPLDDCTFMDEEMLCPDCQEEHTRVCDHCGSRIWLNDVYGDDDVTLCRNCLEFVMTMMEKPTVRAAIISCMLILMVFRAIGSNLIRSSMVMVLVLWV